MDYYQNRFQQRTERLMQVNMAFFLTRGFAVLDSKEWFNFYDPDIKSFASMPIFPLSSFSDLKM